MNQTVDLRQHYLYLLQDLFSLPPDISEEGTNVRLAVETLEELDWCLDQLESLQTHKVIIIIIIIIIIVIIITDELLITRVCLTWRPTSSSGC